MTQDRGAVVIGVLAIAVPVTTWAVDRRNPEPEPHPGADADETDQQSPPMPELVISNDGDFVGGDEVATDVVLELLLVPAAQRAVTVRAEPLDDVDYRRRLPDQFARLRTAVRSYEDSVNRLMRGRIYYYYKWEVTELIAAVLELRAIALPAQFERESWYVWPAGSLSPVVRVRLAAFDVESVQTGYYGEDFGHFIEDDERGLPQEEPIWLQQIFPRIVWTRVVPAVLADTEVARRLSEAGSGPLDISDWVLSDRPPTGLARSRPPDLSPADERRTWTW